MYKVSDIITDRYGRTHKIIEKVQKTGAKGEPYTLYNLYPPATKPKRATEHGKSLGLQFEPYLYMTEDTLKEITNYEH